MWIKCESLKQRTSTLLLSILLLQPLLSVEAQNITLPIAVAPSSKALEPIVLHEALLADWPKLNLTSPYWLVVDASAQMVMAKNGAETRIEPASMTKVMTAYLLFKAIKEGRLNEREMVKPEKFTEGSRMFLDDRVEVSVGDLLHGMIIQSGNDASISLAKKLAGSEAQFAEQMNAMAQKLGMKNTHFMNATGLPDPNHYTTLDDLAILALALIRDYPDFYPLFSQKEFVYNNIHQPNRNALLNRNIGADGIKTGHTESAGYCILASAIRGERRVIVITAKAPSEAQRFADAEQLIHAAYDSSEIVKLYRRDQEVERITVWKGSENDVPVGVSQDLVLMVPKGAGARLSAKLVYTQPILAPLAAGQSIGKMVLTLDGKTYAEYPVVALQEVGKASWWRLLWHSVRLWLK